MGYLFGIRWRIVLNDRALPKQDREYNPKTLREIGILFYCIGIGAHILYYSTHSITSYADSYTAGQGSGYITVFFNFWILGMVLIEYLSYIGENSTFVKWGNRFSIFFYCFLYFVVFMKRRQIILLLLSVIAIWTFRITRGRKLLYYLMGIVGIIVFTVFGKVRGYIDVFGFDNLWAYICENFTWDWLSLGELEGKYISRTLNDVYAYVQNYGNDPSILLGIVFCMVPGSLLGGNKPLAFPDWYTQHFYPADFARGTGYAGSMIGELYLIGGVVVVIVGYLFLGYLCARIQKRGMQQQDIQGRLVYSIFIYSILLMPRYDLASLLIDMTFFYFPLVIALKCSQTRESKGRVVC